MVEQFFATPSGLWLEYNRERMAFQMMGMCENLDAPILVAHLPVSAETASLWADVDLRPVP